MAGVRVVRAEEMHTPAVTTPGMDRREAFDHDGVWAGTLTTSAGIVTGWHVHAGHDTYIYIARGLIHREGTAAGSTGVEAVLVRVGEGEPVTNVDGPEPG